VPRDARVLRRAHLFDHADGGADDARRVREAVVGGDNHDAVLDEELSPDLGDLLGPAQALHRVHGDQVHRHEAEFDLPQHLLETGPASDELARNGVVPVGLDVDPGVSVSGANLLDGLELLLR